MQRQLAQHAFIGATVRSPVMPAAAVAVAVAVDKITLSNQCRAQLARYSDGLRHIFSNDGAIFKTVHLLHLY